VGHTLSHTFETPTKRTRPMCQPIGSVLCATSTRRPTTERLQLLVRLERRARRGVRVARRRRLVRIAAHPQLFGGVVLLVGVLHPVLALLLFLLLESALLALVDLVDILLLLLLLRIALIAQRPAVSAGEARSMPRRGPAA
jgi:VIT1/CCC1 family predicted Fe2+/Mn2+ transporter